MSSMTTEHITAFRKAFKIDKTLNLSEDRTLIEAIYDAQSEAYTAVWGIDLGYPSGGFSGADAVQSALPHVRVHVQAMLVASVTRSPTSSEVCGLYRH